jgi:periplasmic copper chaperone A
MRLAWPGVVGGVAVLALGAAGLIVAAVPQSSSAAGTSPGAVTVADAYVRAPVQPVRDAAAYFTVYNTNNQPDRITGVQTGAGASAQLRDAANQPVHAAVVRPHGKLVLHPGGLHVVIGQLFGRLTPGQDVDIEVDFARAGPIDVVAKVIAYGTTPPGGH